MRSVSISLVSARLNQAAQGQREGYNSIPITLVGTVLPPLLICRMFPRDEPVERKAYDDELLY